MYVCVCNGIRERDIQRALDEGVSTVSGIYRHLKHKPTCGKCVPFTVGIVKSHRTATADALLEAAE